MSHRCQVVRLTGFMLTGLRHQPTRLEPFRATRGAQSALRLCSRRRPGLRVHRLASHRSRACPGLEHRALASGTALFSPVGSRHCSGTHAGVGVQPTCLSQSTNAAHSNCFCWIFWSSFTFSTLKKRPLAPDRCRIAVGRMASLCSCLSCFADTEGGMLKTIAVSACHRTGSLTPA